MFQKLLCLATVLAFLLPTNLTLAGPLDRNTEMDLSQLHRITTIDDVNDFDPGGELIVRDDVDFKVVVFGPTLEIDGEPIYDLGVDDVFRRGFHIQILEFLSSEDDGQTEKVYYIVDPETGEVVGLLDMP